MTKHQRRARGSPASPSWVQLPLEEPTPEEQRTPPAAGEWLDVLIADLAVELGDGARVREHQDTVRRLWEQSGLTEGDFAQVLMQVRGRATSWRSRTGQRQVQGDPSTRMKAFVVLLRDRLGVLEGPRSDDVVVPGWFKRSPAARRAPGFPRA